MLVIGGGRVAPNPSNEVDIYDPSTNTWTTGLFRIHDCATQLRGRYRRHLAIWLAGGYASDGIPLATTEIRAQLRDTDSDADSHADRDSHTNTNGHANGNVYAYTHRNSDVHAYAYGYSHIHAYPDRHGHIHAYAYGDSYIYAYRLRQLLPQRRQPSYATATPTATVPPRPTPTPRPRPTPPPRP